MSNSSLVRLAMNPIGSLLEGFLEEADFFVSCLLDGASVLDSRQSAFPGHEDGAAEPDEGKETKTSLRNVVSPGAELGDRRAFSQTRTFKTCFLPSRARACSSLTRCREPLMPEYGPA